MADMRDYVVSHVDEAIERGWVRPFYQPVVRTVSGKLCGMEALARWDDPEHGLLSPTLFVPVLEQAHLVHKLDSCIVRQVCRQLRENIDEGRSYVPISFNLSRLDFDLCDIHSVIEGAVREFEVPRSLVNIEITESVFGADPAFMGEVLDRFHDIGYQVWMDDFGSAYSSLNVLKDFDFDEMKIDLKFLSNFDERSRAIIASVVDMAKRLGIQTLAEGVETREHAEFLRHIGCEKQQGYFYGRPEPYGAALVDQLGCELGVEEQGERQYYHTIGSVNTLSLSERDFMEDNTSQDYVTSMPLAFVEFDGDRFHVLDYNTPFVEGLQSAGIDGVGEAERLINDRRRAPARAARRLIEVIPEAKFSRQDYVSGERACVMRAKHISSYGDRTTVLVTVDSATSVSEKQRRERMREALESLYSIYEHVDILHLSEGYSEPVFSQATFKSVYDVPDLREAVRQFSENEIFPVDRARYLAFMDVDTMLERIDGGGQGYVVGFFRVRDRGGDYAWKLFGLIGLDEQFKDQVMVCVRDTNWENDALFQAAYEQGDEFAPGGISNAADLRVSDGSLWRALVEDAQVGIFWKDAKRRFIGCNRKFLDYYGFDSVDAVIGKTDEDMGWHIDPVPFMNDELRVLGEGASVENAIGQCIVRGEVRDIVATKRPVYRNGRIVGLVGYFLDVSSGLPSDDGASSLPVIDPITGVLNYTGLEAATWRYVDAYKRQNVDFAMVSVNVEDFKVINDRLGYAFGDKVLRRVGDELRAVAGERAVVGHVYAERFVVLMQGESDEALQELCERIEERLMGIARIDDTPCTVFALAGFSRFSEAGDIEAMKRRNQEGRNARRDEWAGSAGGDDLITSNVLG